jgi:hypothetical protein
MIAGSGGKADMMRGGGYLVVVAGVVVLSAGCGTQVAAQAGNVAAAAASTAGQTARVAVTTTMRTQGMSVAFTEAGAFDFAHSRGVLRMQGPGGLASEELFVPPKTYAKLPGGVHGLLPHGKSWIAVDSAASGLGTPLLGPFAGTDPRDLLSSLTAVSSGVTRLGGATVRGVPVMHFRLDVDPAKAASRVPSWRRAGFQAFARTLGAATIPVDVWVDQQNRVRRVGISLSPRGGSGVPPGARVAQTVDFYDFGVAVRVSAPPAAQVASISQLSNGGGSSNAVMAGAGGSPRPPRVSGTLSPAQAAAATEAVRVFWSALGRNDQQAAAESVVPAQRMCFRSMMGGPRFTVTSLRIVSAQPDGNTKAVVRFTVKARASIGGQSVPVLPQGPGRVQWLVTTQAAGHWHVDLGHSTSLAFGPACQ